MRASVIFAALLVVLGGILAQPAGAVILDGGATATIDVSVACVPSDDPGVFGVQLQFPTGGASNILASCGDQLPFTGLAPGTFTVTQFEVAGTPWKLSDYTMSFSGDCAADGTVSASAGSTSSCTITRTRITPLPPPPATLDVSVACVPSDDPGVFGVQLQLPTGGASNILASCGDRLPFTGLTPGTYTVTQFEVAGTPWKLSDYTMSFSGDCAADGSVSLSAGSTSSCTITRTRITPLPPPPATLDVTIACVPTDDPGLFGVQLQLPTGGATNIEAGCGDQLPFTGLTPGTYTVTQFELAGTPWKLSDYTMSFSGDCAADGWVSLSAGSTSSCTITRTLKPDTTPPVTTDDAPTGWVNHDVVVHLSATDDRSGVQATYYRIDDGAEQQGDTVTIPASADHANDGVHTVDFYSVDNAGNAEPAHEILVEIDTTSPTVQYSGNSGTYSVDQTIDIACTASDDLSGIASSTCTDVNAPAYGFELGTTTLSASATDNAGNTGTGSTAFTVVVDSPGVDRLITRFFAGDADGSAGLIAKADAVASAPTASAKSGAIGAFDNDAQAKVGKQLTQAQADVLETLVAAL